MTKQARLLVRSGASLLPVLPNCKSGLPCSSRGVPHARRRPSLNRSTPCWPAPRSPAARSPACSFKVLIALHGKNLSENSEFFPLPLATRGVLDSHQRPLVPISGRIPMHEVVQVKAAIPRALKRRAFAAFALRDEKFAWWLRTHLESWLQDVEEPEGAAVAHAARHAVGAAAPVGGETT